MSKQTNWLTLIIIILAGSLLTVSAQDEDTTRISMALTVPDEVAAGDAWEAMVRVKGMAAGDTVQLTLLHGISIRTEELVLGSGGIAVREFAEGDLTQAGTTQVSARAGDIVRTATVTITADIPSDLTTFTTGNSLRAYGDDETSLVTLIHDRFGNPVDDAALTVQKTAPSGESRTGFTRTQNGLASQTLSSLGDPGILRINVRYGTQLELDSTIVQLASVPATLDLALSSECVLMDGLDMLTLTARVTDRHDYPVTDGQIVTFSWDGGRATAITVDGSTSLTIPPPQEAGTFTYMVSSHGLTTSSDLTVAEVRCVD